MELWVPIIITVLVIVTILISRRENINEAHEDLSENLAEKDDWAKEKLLSAYDVKRMRDHLKAEIETYFTDKDRKDLLNEIVSEWAELKMITFQDRRSWVRSHDEKKDDN